MEVMTCFLPACETGDLLEHMSWSICTKVDILSNIGNFLLQSMYKGILFRSV